MSGELSRRRLLHNGAMALAGGAVGGGTFPAGRALGSAAAPALRAPPLRPGDRVRVVAPGRTPGERLARGIEILRGWGLRVEVGSHVHDRHGYLAGTDADRTADLNAAFRTPGIRGVFAAAGGYGTQRVVDGLDVAAVRRDPRVFVGFSDITSLHGRLWRAARLVTFYGPMLDWNDARTGPDSIESLRRAIMTTAPIVVTRDPAEPSAAIEVSGRASGILRGGNLTLLDTGFGTGDSVDLDGAILFFEDIDEEPYSYDRMLTHLRRVGALKKVAGVAIGQLTNASGTSWDVQTVLRDRLTDLGVPVLGGLRLGHGKGQLTVPLGSMATIDTATATLTVQSGVDASS